MDLKLIVESLLFQAQKPMSLAELRDILATAAERSDDAEIRGFKRTRVEAIGTALEQLAEEIDAAQRSYQLVCVAGSWQVISRPAFAPWLRVLLGEKPRPPRLSLPGLETLAILAYRQPITRAEIEQIRGVSVDGVIQTLLERGLIEAVGRAEVIGRPITYGTTAFFLEYFGLQSLEDLPAADELRRIPVNKPEALLTTDPGLATVPPAPLEAPAVNQSELNLESPGAPASADAHSADPFSPPLAPGPESSTQHGS
jgi:segregation and condensation protein B